MKTNFTLFLFAIGITFSMIAVLQFTPMPWFFLVLLCMHVGIFLFILSKKRFRRAGYEVGKYYKREYCLLAFYIPILLAKIMQNFGWISLDARIKTVIVLILTGICAALSAANAVCFWREELKKAENAARISQ